MAENPEHSNAKSEQLTQFVNIIQSFADEAVTRDKMKAFAEQIGNQHFLVKLMQSSETNPDAFIKNYLSYLKLVYPAQKAEDSRQKALNIIIQNSATESSVKANTLPTPSNVDLPPINFKLQSPLDEE